MLAISAARLGLQEASHEATLKRAVVGLLRFGPPAGISRVPVPPTVVIDTAASYGGGDSERLVGKVLGDGATQDAVASAGGEVRVVSKFGYHLASADAAGNWPTATSVQTSAGGGVGGGGGGPAAAGGNVMHCLHPDFMRAELEGSLSRLGRASIDTWLVDTPEQTLNELAVRLNAEVSSVHRGARHQPLQASKEAHLVCNSSTTFTHCIPHDKRLATQPDCVGHTTKVEMGDLTAQAMEKHVAEAKASLLTDLVETFVALEEAVAGGLIGSYGVSSQGLVLPTSDALHMEWTALSAAASQAASRAGTAAAVGGRGSNFRTLQFPLNVLEQGGDPDAAPGSEGGGGGAVALAQEASLHGLTVMTTRPLTAVTRREKGANPSGRADAGIGWPRRLVDGTLTAPPTGYMDACQRCLEHFHHEVEGEPDEEDVELIEACRWLQTLVSDMNRQLVELVSVQQYEHELTYGELPLLNRSRSRRLTSILTLSPLFLPERPLPLPLHSLIHLS